MEGTSRAPERREIQMGEGEGLSGGNSSVHSSIKLGAYAGRLSNLNLAGINNPIPNLNTVYIDTPLDIYIDLILLMGWVDPPKFSARFWKR